MNPNDLIRIARHLAMGGVGSGLGRPRQTDLRRAISAAYYALFHTLARCGADMVVGSTPRRRSQAAWDQVYRALEHGHARNQFANMAVMGGYSAAIQDFGAMFIYAQRMRQRADYNPDAIALSRYQIVSIVNATSEAIDRFNAAPAAERRAFAVHALFRLRRD